MRFLFVFFLSCITFSLSAATLDSLRLTVGQADSLFVRNNLLLLAERFRIEASQADIIQASLFENPTVAVELSAYNSTRNRVLDVGRQGQKIVSVQQLLYTAGKRNKRIALAEESAKLTEYEFTDLLRALRFDLRSRFYESYFQQNTIRRYDQQIATLQTTVNAYETQYEKANVSLRELLRLKALVFQLRNDRTDLVFQLAENQKALRTLLSIEQPITLIVNEAGLTRYRLPVESGEQLREKAFANRADLKVSQSLTRQSELNYNFQRALARPDLSLSGVYDQQGSYISNYIGVGVAMSIPVWNRNQGGIKAARSQIDYQKRLEENKHLQIANEVSTVLQKVQEVERTVQSVEGRFTEQFEELSIGVTKNFGKGNISLLEFVDLIETYNESVRELNRLKADRIGAYEELNYVVGEDLFR
ncbi:TolC family protein [Tellurirhabdus bombi]|uniref:TolC family protein n=1 Tax=Tellurirhabdus bombi TaxID=2907205 RepID=UPI001F34478F|nr:TolC family protein [Tellurirhabdus bombi]